MGSGDGEEMADGAQGPGWYSNQGDIDDLAYFDGHRWTWRRRRVASGRWHEESLVSGPGELDSATADQAFARNGTSTTFTAGETVPEVIATEPDLVDTGWWSPSESPLPTFQSAGIDSAESDALAATPTPDDTLPADEAPTPVSSDDATAPDVGGEAPTSDLWNQKYAEPPLPPFRRGGEVDAEEVAAEEESATTQALTEAHLPPHAVAESTAEREEPVAPGRPGWASAEPPLPRFHRGEGLEDDDGDVGPEASGDEGPQVPSVAPPVGRDPEPPRELFGPPDDLPPPPMPVPPRSWNPPEPDPLPPPLADETPAEELPPPPMPPPPQTWAGSPPPAPPPPRAEDRLQAEDLPPPPMPPPPKTW